MENAKTTNPDNQPHIGMHEAIDVTDYVIMFFFGFCPPAWCNVEKKLSVFLLVSQAAGSCLLRRRGAGGTLRSHFGRAPEIVTASKDGSARVWRADNGECPGPGPELEGLLR